ncbi:MAG: CDP-alcohol phosphatidyltransferase family protein [Pseudomonadota bacterium]
MTLAWLPNAISILRILLVPPAVAAMLGGRHDIALGLVLVAALSDGIDGWLARHKGWGSALGAFLDPLADKLLMLAAYATLGWLAAIPPWLPFLVIGRDLFIIGGAAWLRRRRASRVAARPVSKLNTFVQAGYILLVLAALVPLPVPAAVVADATVLVVLTTLASGLDYLGTFRRMANAGDNDGGAS